MSDLQVFTLGYQLRELDEFIAELRQACVDLVIDVRETPWSRKRGFSKAALREALADAGIAYEHARFAGNPKELRRGAEDHDDCLRQYAAYLDGCPEILDKLTDLLTESDRGLRRVCLVCYERHPADCHRTILLDRWSRRRRTDVHIKHLAPSGAPRLASV